MEILHKSLSKISRSSSNLLSGIQSAESHTDGAICFMVHQEPERAASYLHWLVILDTASVCCLLVNEHLMMTG
ncbi:unnamed protein product [Cylicostephanus goldi]|uniref:Uncharacterized protein n=1 Tax=Cylicostephanus goldi TaxID=71465 RepID=A0A3P7NHI5_CYLGO|nr:unnamed protein product [Cylicostephanus goldi]